MTDLTILDYAILALVAISAAFSYRRGFTSELLSILDWILSLLAALAVGPLLAPKLMPYVATEGVARAGAMLIVFIVAMIVFSLVSDSLMRRLEGRLTGPSDRTLGILFGIVRGALIAALAYYAFTLVIPEAEHPYWVSDAMLRPALRAGMRLVETLLPSDLIPPDFFGEEP